VAVCVIWISGTNDNTCIKYVESVLLAINSLSKQLTSKVTIKEDSAEVSGPIRAI